MGRSRRVTVACFALAFLPSHRAALPVYGSDDDSSLLSGWSFRTSFDQPAITAESLFVPTVLRPVFSSFSSFTGNGIDNHQQHSSRVQLAGRVFEHFAKKCVIGHNIKGGRFANLSRAECARKCLDEPDCVGFELGLGDGDSHADYKDKDCQLNDGDDTFACDALFYGLEWYKLLPRNAALEPPDESDRPAYSFFSSINDWWGGEPSVSVVVGGSADDLDTHGSVGSASMVKIASPKLHFESSYSLVTRGKRWGERTEQWAGHKWKHMPGKCIMGHNIRKIENTTIDECAQLCTTSVPRCVGFEYGVGGSHESYKAHDCQLNDSDREDLGDCDARWWGMEFYLRLPDGTAAADERKANGDADGGVAVDAEVKFTPPDM